MRLGWRIPLPGPFFLGGTVWRSRRRYVPADYWTHGTCTIRHRSQGAADRCRGTT